MNKFWRIITYVAVGLIVVGIGLFGALALWNALTLPDIVRIFLATIFVIFGLGGILIGILRRQMALSLLPFGIACIALFIWWSNVTPSNDRDWQRDVALLPSAEVNGNLITLRNVRNFRYRSETDFSPDWYDKTVDLRDLKSLDLIAVYWMGDAIAHTILSFNFGDDPIAISIEIRKEKGEAFSALAGFFRRYELTYVVADERDLIQLRTTYRQNPKEDVYLYRLKARPERVRALFIQYMAKINELRDQPEFYNTATTNCTTNIVTHIEAIQPNVPLSWKMLASGYFPDLVYERGGLDQSLSFKELRRKSLINDRAITAKGSDDFSHRIRSGLPGMN